MVIKKKNLRTSNNPYLQKAILSIGYGHNATVGLSLDGKVVCLLSEERPSRIKNAEGFPSKSMNYILDTYLEGDINNVAKVVINEEYLFGLSHLKKYGLEPKRPGSGSDNIMRKKKIFENIKNKKFTRQKDKFLSLLVKFRNQIRNDRKYNSMLIDFLCKELRLPQHKVDFLNHQKAHALAGMYFVNQNKKHLIFTLDGEGDFLSGSVNIWEDGKLKIISKISNHTSLGYVYMFVTGYLGMKMNEHEFKVMGMAPYANKEHAIRIRKYFNDLMWVDREGMFRSKRSTHDIKEYLIQHLMYERFDNICGGIQLFCEEIIQEWVKYWIKKTKITSIILGGGVFMNVKAVKRVYELSGVKQIFVVPSAGDESIVIGGLFAGNQKLKQPIKKMENLYLGREFDEIYIKNYLKTLKGRYKFKKYSEDEMAREVANLLAKNEVVARCCGKEEWGARALGNRSILCNASELKNLNKLNQEIKKRDFWMPFTPSILKDDLNKYIINPKKMEVPYMCITFDSTKLAREKIPAALHPRDYTIRPQEVDKSWNPGYYKILKEFKKLTGSSGILNTSFNLHGEPNVGSPEDAIYTLDNSELNWVIIGPYLVEKIR